MVSQLQPLVGPQSSAHHIVVWQLTCLTLALAGGIQSEQTDHASTIKLIPVLLWVYGNLPALHLHSLALEA